MAVMTVQTLLSALGPEIEDPEEGTSDDSSGLLFANKSAALYRIISSLLAVDPISESWVRGF